MNVIWETADAVKRTIPVVFLPVKWGLAVSIVLYICTLRIEGNTLMGVVCSVPVLNIPLNQMDLCESSMHLPTQDLVATRQVHNSPADLQLQAGYGGALRQYLREGGNAIYHLISAVEVSMLDNKEPLMNHLTTIADTVGPLERNLSAFGGEVHALVDSVKGNNERALNGLREISKLIDKQEAHDHVLLHIIDPFYLFHYGPKALNIPKQKRERVTEDFLRVAETIAMDIPELLRILGDLQHNLIDVDKQMDKIKDWETAEIRAAGEKAHSRRSRSTLTYLWHRVTGEEERQMELFKNNAQLLDSIVLMQEKGKDIISKSLSILRDMDTGLKQLNRFHSKIFLRKKKRLEELIDVIDGAVKRLSSTEFDPVRKTATMIESS